MNARYSAIIVIFYPLRSQDSSYTLKGLFRILDSRCISFNRYVYHINFFFFVNFPNICIINKLTPLVILVRSPVTIYSKCSILYVYLIVRKSFISLKRYQPTEYLQQHQHSRSCLASSNHVCIKSIYKITLSCNLVPRTTYRDSVGPPQQKYFCHPKSFVHLSNSR